jgi:hypothetical protein
LAIFGPEFAGSGSESHRVAAMIILPRMFVRAGIAHSSVNGLLFESIAAKTVHALRTMQDYICVSTKKIDHVSFLNDALHILQWEPRMSYTSTVGTTGDRVDFDF